MLVFIISANQVRIVANSLLNKNNNKYKCQLRKPILKKLKKKFRINNHKIRTFSMLKKLIKNLRKTKNPKC